MAKQNEVEMPAAVLEGAEAPHPKRKGRGSFITAKGMRTPSFEEMAAEVTSLSTYETLVERDLAAVFTGRDWIKYRIESMVTAEPAMRYFFLVLFSFSLVMILSLWWVIIPHPEDNPMEETLTFRGAVYLTLNVLTTGGYNGDVVKANEKIAYFFMIAAGLLVVAVLIGIVTDSVSATMDEQINGSTKVVESNHTLILGWNNSTPRLVCQIAFLRRVYRMLNETWPRRLFPWLRIEASSPVAKYKVVLMNNQLTKIEMEVILARAFSEARIKSHRTKIGRDVIIRVGDPTSTHDLIRVAAQRATSIALQMTSVDEAESEYSNGRISNSASIRSLLALRSLFLSNGNPLETFNKDLRVVVQLQQTCPFIESACFVSPSGSLCVYPMDLSKLINTVMFQSASKPGLTRVLSELLDFEDCAIRCRPASQMSGGVNNALGFFVGKTARAAMLGAQWKEAVLIGVENGSAAVPSLYRGDEHSSMLCKPSRVIQPGDWLIFVGRTSNPQRTDSKADLADFKAQADTLMLATSTFKGGSSEEGSSGLNNQHHLGLSESGGASRPVGIARRLSAIDFGQLSLHSEAQHVLVMGWRPEWNAVPASFRGRLRDISDGLPLGSTVTCLNVKTQREFDELLCTHKGTHKGSKLKTKNVAWPVNKEEAAGGGFESGWNINGGSGDRTFQIFHFCGDPVHFESVAALLKSPAAPVYDTAICLGNVVGADLSADARDSRVLSMFLILRQLTEHDPKWSGRSIHIISENQIDQTAHLAVTPKRHMSDNPLAFEETLPASFVKTSSPESKSDKALWAYVREWADPLEVLSSPEFPEPSKVPDPLGGRLEARSKSVHKAASKFSAPKRASGSAEGKETGAGIDSAFLHPGEKFRFEASKIVDSNSEDSTVAIFYQLSGKAGGPSPGWVHDQCTSHPGRRAICVISTPANPHTSVSARTPEPDLMNSNAVIARALALTLAYPQIEASVMDLVSTTSGTPEIEFYPPHALGLLGCGDGPTTSGKIAFGVVQSILDALYGGYASALGYILASDGCIQLAPPTGTLVAWDPADRVVVLIRHAPKPEVSLAPTTSPGQKPGSAAGSAFRAAVDAMAAARKAPPSLEATQAQVEANAKKMITVLEGMASLQRQLESLGATDPKAIAAGTHV